ncbi:MAG: ATP-dependent RNA helicase HrpA [Succinivibrionaceae bacterium]|nr:ATP-dependent RNA helicase HrpA [Succinivibrionaceae bacterium]
MGPERRLPPLDPGLERGLRPLLAEVSLLDRRRIMLRCRDLRQGKGDPAAILAAAGEAAAAARRRLMAMPTPSYPSELPVSAERERIVGAIRSHQVVIIAGETGSGKTTQLPKMCLEAGCGRRGMIGHTQPRRIAARAVAARIAEELGEPLGLSVGYKVRFTDHCPPTAFVKIMTDGVLLAEIPHDRLLLQYDCLIIDEAHERSLNIDFLLGYVGQILPRRPDLRLVITSATIDPERFSRHFGNAPIIEVKGRTYPVEVAYQPLHEDGRERDLTLEEGVAEALAALQSVGPGDTLVFLPGERDIMDVAAYLGKQNLRGVEIVPLFARLSAAEQARIFAPHPGIRVVLSTNVAETSLTVPGIRYVIDSGLARISRYSTRTKIQRLPIEPISQASANQRKGRCGRMESGICVRLYSEEDFLSRPEFTEPEILRTNLAQVILQMASLGLGAVESFPFIDPPEGRQVTDGLRLLEELEAIEPTRGEGIRLTRVGRELARIPADPRLSRVLLEAGARGCLREALIVVGALAVMDPRERPLDRREAAAQAHARFRHEQSDFLSYVLLWRYLDEQRAALSTAQFRRLLRHDFLSYLRVREWVDTVRQLRATMQIMGLREGEPSDEYEPLHRALLKGFISQVAFYKDPERHAYQGARGSALRIHPSSGLGKRPPKWICFAEARETTQAFALTVAKVDPLWVEEAAPHLIKRSYQEPRWSRERGQVVASLTVTLYGLTLASGREVPYGKVDPALSRSIFIRDGLVPGALSRRPDFVVRNLALIEEVEGEEERGRRRDRLVDPSELEAFYAARLPEAVLDERTLWRHVRGMGDQKDLLFTRETVLREGAGEFRGELYPTAWRQGRLTLPLTYVFDPTREDDGVTVHLPLAVLAQVDGADFVRQVPGLRLELMTALIRGLPKRLRVNLIPAPEFARALHESLEGQEGGDFLASAAHELTRMGGAVVEPGDFDLGALPAHLRMTFCIEDQRGKPLERGKDFGALRGKYLGKSQEALQRLAAPRRERVSGGDWPFGRLRESEERREGALSVTVYPALLDRRDKVALGYCQSREQAVEEGARGLARLLVLSLADPTAYLERSLPNRAKLSMYYTPLGPVRDLILDLSLAAARDLMAESGIEARDAEGFSRLREYVRPRFNERALELAALTEQALSRAHELRRRLKGRIGLEVARAYADVSAQLSRLVRKGFVFDCAADDLRQYPRYLEGALLRLERAPRDPARDSACLARVEAVQDELESALGRYAGRFVPLALRRVWLMIEELRISYFAQQLGARIPISDKRVHQEIERVLREEPPRA